MKKLYFYRLSKCKSKKKLNMLKIMEFVSLSFQNGDWNLPPFYTGNREVPSECWQHQTEFDQVGQIPPKFDKFRLAFASLCASILLVIKEVRIFVKNLTTRPFFCLQNELFLLLDVRLKNDYKNNNNNHDHNNSNRNNNAKI